YLVNEELMIVQPDSKDVTRLPTKAKDIYWFRVSPDGKRLAYTAIVHGKFKIYVTDLFSESSLISSVLRLAGQDIPEGDALEGEMDACFWSPDGKKLICLGGRLGATRNWIVDLNTKERTELHLPDTDWVRDLSKDENWYSTFKIDKEAEERESHVSLVKK